MQTALQITFRKMEVSPAAEAAIRERAEALGQFYDRITSCKVVVEHSGRHHHKGRLYHLGIELIVPGREIVIKRDPSQHHAHEDIYVAIREAFDSARRALEDHIRCARGDVKNHEKA
jgi:ribosomal subunit interface protein